MSNTLAIAAVTAMLKDILENRLANHPVAISIGDLLVTALPPDRITVGSDERPQLNVFLYQVSQNRNADWVSRDRLSNLSGKQQRDGLHELQDKYTDEPSFLALDLHYLITAYGAKDFQSELLLGYAMQVLHDIPLITREMVCVALKHAAAMTTFGALSQVLSTLSIEDLAEQVGEIKLGPEFFSMEETSKLWSSLQTHYRPSAGYQASMVLFSRPALQNSAASASLLPKLLQPTVERVGSLGTAAIHAGDMLILHGQRLQGTFTHLRITGHSALLSPHTVQDEQITLLLPPDLPAGIQSIQVVHLDNSRSGDVQEIQSNLVTFAIQPSIHVQVTSVQSLQQELHQVEITLTVKPLINSNQSVFLLLNHSNHSLSTQLPVPLADSLTETLSIPIQVPGGDYWIQLQVGGVRSEAVGIQVKS